MAKISISLDDGLIDRIDRAAEMSYISRSGLISVACTQYINSTELIYSVNEMALCFRKIAEQGAVDDETYAKLEDLERVCKLFVTGK